MYHLVQHCCQMSSNCARNLRKYSKSTAETFLRARNISPRNKGNL